MIEIEKAGKEHFESIYGLLSEFDNPHVSKDDWAALFSDRWGSGQDYHGYLLRDGGEVVGFCGYLFSRRSIRGNEVKFCNLTSWIVRPEYRNHSLALLYPILNAEGYVLTSLTPSKKVVRIKQRLGFKELESRIEIILPLRGFRPAFKQRNFRLILDRETIKNSMEGSDLQIYKDHSGLKCIFALLQSGQETCFLVMTRVMRRNLPFLSVLHIGHPALFVRHCQNISGRILSKYKGIGFLIDSRLLRGEKIKGSLSFPFRRFPSITFLSSLPRLYKSNLKDQTVEPADIDNLYSELAVLHM